MTSSINAYQFHCQSFEIAFALSKPSLRITKINNFHFTLQFSKANLSIYPIAIICHFISNINQRVFPNFMTSSINAFPLPTIPKTLATLSKVSLNINKINNFHFSLEFSKANLWAKPQLSAILYLYINLMTSTIISSITNHFKAFVTLTKAS